MLATVLSTAAVAFPFFVLEVPCSAYRLWTKRTPSSAWTLHLEEICLWRIFPFIGALFTLTTVPVFQGFEIANGNHLVQMVFVATWVLAVVLPTGLFIYAVSLTDCILITALLITLSTIRYTSRSENPRRNLHTSLECCVIFQRIPTVVNVLNHAV